MVIWSAVVIYVIYLPIYFRVASDAGQSYDYPSTNEVTLRDAGTSAIATAQQNTAKHKPCPTDTWRNDNVIIASKRRRNVRYETRWWGNDIYKYIKHSSNIRHADWKVWVSGTRIADRITPLH